ncbi:hypothetical protein CY34DRAFT_566219 [Suillus luteus UH-Slu-Lm8-n1]|uniref:Glyceraldehyde 3-phosphate dehydrogenase catalytic domain-containing protein n=1 Tax=Suillus luteus UH-Slu-Lm8-n1 TaxID=930992 RepID=A0A0D0AUR0_9AGAM|nr:hypothetical protein CY34DRAFT_566219 [Suillus luteus UH-Slu-Lm8-n1]
MDLFITTTERRRLSEESFPRWIAGSLIESRVPIVNVSVVDLVVNVKSSTCFGVITTAMREAEEGPLKSVSFVRSGVYELAGGTESAVFNPRVAFGFHSGFIRVAFGFHSHFIRVAFGFHSRSIHVSFKLVIYYVNEWGYSKCVCEYHLSRL